MKIQAILEFRKKNKKQIGKKIQEIQEQKEIQEIQKFQNSQNNGKSKELT